MTKSLPIDDVKTIDTVRVMSFNIDFYQQAIDIGIYEGSIVNGSFVPNKSIIIDRDSLDYTDFLKEMGITEAKVETYAQTKGWIK